MLYLMRSEQAMGRDSGLFQIFQRTNGFDQMVVRMRYANVGGSDQKAMDIFSYKRRLRMFEREHLPFARTLADHDIINAIGEQQAVGQALTLKQILSYEFGPAATIERRLARLKRLGIVLQKRSKVDQRVIELKLSPRVLHIFQRYADLIASIGYVFVSE
jgi:hypothetical protein